MAQALIEWVGEVDGDVVASPGDFSSVSGKAEVQASYTVAHLKEERENSRTAAIGGHFFWRERGKNEMNRK